jgi:hypothetical protein
MAATEALPVTPPADALYRAARDEARGHPQADDMTAIVVKVGTGGRVEAAAALSAP